MASDHVKKFIDERYLNDIWKIVIIDKKKSEMFINQ